MWQCIYGCNFIQNYDKRFFFKLKKVRKKCQFLTFYHFSPPAPQRDFSECLRALLCPEGCRLKVPNVCFLGRAEVFSSVARDFGPSTIGELS